MLPDIVGSNWNAWYKCIPSLPEDTRDPAQIALRTYALSLSLSLGPSLVPFIIGAASGKQSPKVGWNALRRVLRREFGHDGFAFAITVIVGGGARLRSLWLALDHPNKTYSRDQTLGIVERLLGKLHATVKVTDKQKTFISYIITSLIGILLIQSGRRRAVLLSDRTVRASSLTTYNASYVNRASPTLDLTLLLCVRALDAVAQSVILKLNPSSPEKGSTIITEGKEKEQRRRSNAQLWTSRLDAFVFWACSARIMWCFFYQPERLPRSYVKWINTMANVDQRLLAALRYIRAGSWSYRRGSAIHRNLLQNLAEDLGYPHSWGDPSILPAFGGPQTLHIWKAISVNGRDGIGGMPCEVVHGGVGSNLQLSHSCTANMIIRGINAYIEALAIYIPVHFLPALATNPRTLLRPHRIITVLLGAFRSAAFLSSFVSLYWYGVCLSRSLVLARLLPHISHDFWDGPYGCMLAGSLMCGSSIWIENGRRRGEIALYVLPRAVRACLPRLWLKNINPVPRILERMSFILSISYLLTSAIHQPESLRGLSRWTVAFVLNGPSAGFWKRQKDSRTSSNFDKINIPPPNPGEGA
ncbi:hypothetical protein BDQ17DRAFT_1340598 [Cyathus striatus]|nr:hypothetical protein BDQ17DRAFT_1340598 [Cyathus striatus]